MAVPCRQTERQTVAHRGRRIPFLADNHMIFDALSLSMEKG